MMPTKESVKCIPVLPVKKQVTAKAFSIRLDPSDISEKTWNRYPCELDDPQKCRNDHCLGRVSFFVTDDAVKDVKILTLLFAREDKNAYFLLNQQLRSLFKDKVLSPVDSVTIQLKPPVMPEPRKRVFP